jgi:hypothetical protein
VQDRDAADAKNNLISRYKEQDIPVAWMSDAGLIAKVHFGNSFPSYCQAWWIVV